VSFEPWYNGKCHSFKESVTSLNPRISFSKNWG